MIVCYTLIHNELNTTSSFTRRRHKRYYQHKDNEYEQSHRRFPITECTIGVPSYYLLINNNCYYVGNHREKPPRKRLEPPNTRRWFALSSHRTKPHSCHNSNGLENPNLIKRQNHLHHHHKTSHNHPIHFFFFLIYPCLCFLLYDDRIRLWNSCLNRF